MPEAAAGKDASRVRTGVAGLDAMLGGGLPRGSVTLLRGGPGAGKTTLAMQFLAQGVRDGERGVYLSLEEPVHEIVANATRHGWEVDKLVETGMLQVHSLVLTRVKDFLKSDATQGNWLISIESTSSSSGFSGEFRADGLAQLVGRLIRDTSAHRLVFDSLTMFTSQFEHRVDLHMETLDLIRGLSKTGCTTLFIAHTDPAGSHVFAAEEYLSHGVVNLHFMQQGNRFLQAIQVLKMRGITHDRELRPYRIGEGGVTVYATESVLGGA